MYRVNCGVSTSDCAGVRYRLMTAAGLTSTLSRCCAVDASVVVIVVCGAVSTTKNLLPVQHPSPYPLPPSPPPRGHHRRHHHHSTAIENGPGFCDDAEDSRLSCVVAVRGRTGSK